MESLNGRDIIQLSTSGTHTIAASAGGDVYVWGENSPADGRLGLGDGCPGFVPSPTMIPTLKKSSFIVSVAAGPLHSAAVTRAGRLMMWGSINGAKLGLGADRRHGVPKTVSRCFPSPSPIISTDCTFVNVSCGTSHTVAVSRSGRIFVWGSSDGGRLGLPGKVGATVGKPTMLPDLCVRKSNGDMVATVAKSVACGKWHTMAMAWVPDDNVNVVFSWGCVASTVRFV